MLYLRYQTHWYEGKKKFNIFLDKQNFMNPEVLVSLEGWMVVIIDGKMVATRKSAQTNWFGGGGVIFLLSFVRRQRGVRVDLLQYDSCWRGDKLKCRSYFRYELFKRQSHKMVKHTQTIRRQFTDELFECVWPFCETGA